MDRDSYTRYDAQLAEGFATLRFVPELEREFDNYLCARDRRSVLFGLLGTFVFVIATLLLFERDLLAAVAASAWVRATGAMSLGATAVIFVLALRPRLYQRLWFRIAPVALLVFLAVGAHSVTYMTAAGSPTALPVYLISVMVVCLSSGLLLRQLAAVNVAVFASFAASALSNGLDGTLLSRLLLVLGAMQLICLGLLYTREATRRRAFLVLRSTEESSRHDVLTGVGNRRKFESDLLSLWQQAQREGSKLALMLIDVDHFKAYNDHYGHQAGDRCLARIGQLMQDSLHRPRDAVYRYGGEEFAVLLYGATPEYAAELAEELRQAVQRCGIPHARSETAATVTVSLGLTVVRPGRPRSPRKFVQYTDEQLYAAKHAGRNRVQLGEQIDVALTGIFRRPRGKSKSGSWQIETGPFARIRRRDTEAAG